VETRHGTRCCERAVDLILESDEEQLPNDSCGRNVNNDTNRAFATQTASATISRTVIYT